MWSHWSYKNASPADLEQGDVLKPNPELQQLVGQYHPYYAENKKNQFYVVITQSCDLVRRVGPCAARYIALCPVRSMRSVVELEFGDRIRSLDGVSYASNRVKSEVERFLARLFNNNEPSYYYLEQEQSAGLAEPMCAMLSLPISFKNEHYDTFLNARIISIDDAFQAKLGASIGQLYSRVGTQDFPQEQMKAKIAEIADSLTLWLDASETQALEALVAEHKVNSPGVLIDGTVLDNLISKIPKKKAQAVERILELATNASVIKSPSSEKLKLRRALENDAAFASFFK